jgi:hypothetical protein
MIPVLIAVGAMYLLLRDHESKPSKPEDSGEDFKPPVPVPDQFDDMAEETIEKVYSGDGFAVFKVGFLQGLKYDDGTDDRFYDYSYVIGDEEGSGFMSSNSDRGTRTVQGQPRVMVWATKRDALEYAERPRDDDPLDPVRPEPDDDPKPLPPNPYQPDNGLGGGFTNLSSGLGGL